jgi:exodeoxyribonuclease V alpha subunit
VRSGPWGGAIFSGRSATGDAIKCIANFDKILRPPAPGELWEIAGEMKRHPNYGDQLHVDRATFLPPKGRLIVGYLAHSPKFVGIGRAKAERLWSVFGEQLGELLDCGDAEKLMELGNLTETDAKSLVSTWKTAARETEVVAFCDEVGRWLA